MAFDGYFLSCVCGEINTAEGANIYKIYQPSREELVLALRKKGFNKKLLISAKGGMARIHFTENAPENPETPPMFCMLARKHFSSARFCGVKTCGFERVAELCFTNSNELGDRVDIKIVCELMGAAANIILVGENGRIIDAARRTGIETAGRIIAPGAVYEYPERQNKLDITKSPAAVTGLAFQKAGRLSAALVSSADGMSPLIAREVAYLAFGEDVDTADKSKKDGVTAALENLKNVIITGAKPCMLKEKSGKPKDFSFTDIKQYGNYYDTVFFDSFSQLLDSFYKEREEENARKRTGGDIEKLLSNLIARTNRRKNNRIKELSLAADRDYLLQSGELIKANLHAIAPGQSSVRVKNFFDEKGGEIDIALDPALNAAGNAAKYFKEYKKRRNAESSLKNLIENDRKEVDYLESVSYALSVTKTAAEIAQIREELTLAGYIKHTGKPRKNQKNKANNILTFESREGYKILVGKNNLQNDYITTVLAGKNDLWFHTKNIPGSHVVVLCGGAQVDGQTIKYAATLAAKNSKAASSSNVPVDYTPIKFVKKPSGAKAGMVIYTTNKTIYVTPGEEV